MKQKWPATRLALTPPTPPPGLHLFGATIYETVNILFLHVIRSAITLKRAQFNKIWTHPISVNFKHNS